MSRQKSLLLFFSFLSKNSRYLNNPGYIRDSLGKKTNGLTMLTDVGGYFDTLLFIITKGGVYMQ